MQPQTDPGVIFLLFVVGIMLLGAVAYIVLLIARWNSNRIRYVQQPRVRSVRLQPDDRPFSAVSWGEINNETPETARQVAETESEKIHFAETAVADTLARLILAEEVDKTKAIKIGTGKKSGEGYQKWARLVAAAIERQKEPEFPTAESIRRPSIVEH